MKQEKGYLFSIMALVVLSYSKPLNSELRLYQKTAPISS
jgi:hypothetical protein